MHHLRKAVWLSIAAALVLAGCQRPQQEPVQTSTSQGGTSMAPSGQSAENRGFALVRVMNAVPTLASADAYVDSSEVFTSVAYKTVTPYKEVPDGRHVISLNREVNRESAANQGNGAANVPQNSESLSGGNYYTVVLLPPDVKGKKNPSSEELQPKVEIFKDDFGSPSTDKAKIRLINAAEGYDDVDLYAPSKDDNLVKSVGFNGDHSYSNIDPMTSALQIRKSGSKTTLATLPVRAFDAGKAYTILVTGDRMTGQKLNVVTVEDQFTTHPGSNATQGNGSDRDNDDNGRSNGTDTSNAPSRPGM